MSAFVKVAQHLSCAVAVLAVMTLAQNTLAATWNKTAASTTYDWNNNANWSTPSVFPNAVDAVADININITGNQTIRLNTAITVGALTIGDSTSTQTIVLAPNGGSLIFDVTSGDATLTRTTGGTGAVTISSGITLNDNLVVTGASANTLTISGSIGEGVAGRSLTKDINSGSLTLALTGTSTYTGATTIDAGTLQVGNGAALGALSPSSAIETNGNLALNRSDTITQGTHFSTAAITGSGSVSQIGGGTVVLNAANSFTGGLFISDGTVSVADLGNQASASSNVGGAYSTITIGAAGTNGTLLYTGGGEVTDRVIDLGGTTGDATINQAGGGTLEFSSNFTASGAGDKFLTLTGTGDGKISGIIVDNSASNTTSLIKSGSGTWTLSNTNTFTGTTSVRAGTLLLTTANALDANSTVSVTATGANTTATLDLNGNDLTLSNVLTLGGSTGTSTPLVTTGAGTLTVNGGVAYANANNPRGGTISGLVSLGNATRTFNIGNSTNGLASDDLTVAADIFETATAGIDKEGAGTLKLSGNNTFTGGLNINNGVVSVDTIGNQASASSNAGGPYSTIRIGNTTTNGTLLYTGAGEITDRVIDLGGTTGDATINHSGGGLLQFTSDFTATGAGAKSLTLAGAGTGEIAGDIVDNSALNNTLVIMAGTGTWTLTGDNTFTGGLNINNGTLSLSTLGNQASASSNAGGAYTTIKIGSGGTSGTLLYTGLGETTDRVIDLAGTTGGATIDQSGGGLLKFTSNFTATGANDKTLTLTGAGDGEIAGVIVNNSAGNTTALAKSGSGTWTLSNANLYTAATTVREGTLKIGATNALPAASTTSVTATGAGVTATLDLNGYDVTLTNVLTLGGTTTTSAPVVTTGSGTLTVNGGITYANANNPLGGSISGNLSLGSATRTFTVNKTSSAADDLTISANISETATAGLTKTGTGTLVLSGANSFTGGLNLNNGTLSVGSLGNQASASSNVGGAYSTIKIGSGGTSATLLYTGAFGETTDRVIDLAGTTGGATIDQSGGGLLKFTSNFTATGGGDKTLILQGAGNGEIAGNIVNNSAANITGVTKTGSGTWTLSGTNSYTGTTLVQGGVLNISGVVNNGTSSTIVSNTAGQKSILNVTGTLTTQLLYLGNTAATVYGAVNLNSGTITASGTTGALNDYALALGPNAGYGYLNMSGGSLDLSTANARFSVGGQRSQATDTAGTGVVLFTGGTITQNTFLMVGRGLNANTAASFTMAGGLLDRSAATQDLRIGDPANGGGRAEFTLAGGEIQNIQGTSLNGGNATNTTSILNVNAGTLTTKTFSKGNTTAYINFNGGLLTSMSSTTTFLPAMNGVYLGGGFTTNDPTGTGSATYTGGLTFDSNGFNDTFAAALLAPTGSGVYSIPVTNGGSGYVGAPIIIITDATGFGATAIANMVDDGSGNGTLKIASITITNPGNNYSGSPTVAIGGGSRDAGGTGATFGAATVSPNTSGGLTKLGAGTLTLSNMSSTYSGGTNITADTIAVAGVGTGGVLVTPLGTGTINIGNSGTLAFSTTGSNQVTMANKISGGGNLNITGSSGNQSFWTGDFSDFSGTLNIGLGANNSLWARTANNTGSTTMKVFLDGTSIQGALGLYDSESSITRTFNIGELSGTTLGVIQSAPSTGNNITVSIGGLGTDSTYHGIIRNAFGANTGTTLYVTKVGGGVLTLTNAANSYSGKTTVADGVLAFTAGNASATAAQPLGANDTLDLGVAGVSSGILRYSGTGATTLAKNINALGNGGDTIQNAGSGLLTLAGTLTKTGTTLTLEGGANGIEVTGVIQGNTGSPNSDLIIDNGATTLSNANTYNGPTYIRSTMTTGILNANAVDALPTLNGRSAVTMDDTGLGGSQLNLTGGFDQAIASLTGAASSAVNLNASTLTIGAASGSTTFAGVISGAGGALIKDNSSTQVLTGANTYSGATTVTGGTLQLAGGGLENAEITVSGGTFLQTAGTNHVTGTGPSSGNLTVNGGTYHLTGGTLDFQDYSAGGAATWTPAANQASTISLTTGTDFEFTGGTLLDVSNIVTTGGAGTFTQQGGNFYIGEIMDGPAALTTINGGYSLLAGAVHFDAFGLDSTPDECCDGVASLNDQLTVLGDVTLDSVVSIDFIGFTPQFGDVFTLICADTFTIDDGFSLTGGYFRVVPTGNLTGPQYALQAIVPEPASVALWSMIGLVGAAAGWRAWQRRGRGNRGRSQRPSAA